MISRSRVRWGEGEFINFEAISQNIARGSYPTGSSKLTVEVAVRSLKGPMVSEVEMTEQPCRTMKERRG